MMPALSDEPDLRPADRPLPCRHTKAGRSPGTRGDLDRVQAIRVTAAEGGRDHYPPVA